MYERVGPAVDVSARSIVSSPFGLIWTPASLPSLAAWYEAVDVPATLVRATQASPTGWAGANWAGSGLGPYTHTAGDTTALAHAALIIVGNRCQTIFTVSGRTAGSVTFYAGTTAGTARSTNATFTEDLTVAGNTTHSFVPSADFDGVVTVVAVYNLSRTEWRPKAGSLGGSLAQATAAKQPWFDSATSGVKFDGTDVFKTGSLSATQPVHYFVVATIDSTTGNGSLIDGTTDTDYCSAYIAGGNIQLYARNPGPVKPVVTDTKAIYEMVFDGANSKLAIDGGAYATGDVGSRDPDGLTLCGYGGTGGLIKAVVHEIVHSFTELLAGDRATTIAYLKAKHGIA